MKRNCVKHLRTPYISRLFLRLSKTLHCSLHGRLGILRFVFWDLALLALWSNTTFTISAAATLKTAQSSWSGLSQHREKGRGRVKRTESKRGKSQGKNPNVTQEWRGWGDEIWGKICRRGEQGYRYTVHASITLLSHTGSHILELFFPMEGVYHGHSSRFCRCSDKQKIQMKPW